MTTDAITDVDSITPACGSFFFCAAAAVGATTDVVMVGAMTAVCGLFSFCAAAAVGAITDAVAVMAADATTMVADADSGTESESLLNFLIRGVQLRMHAPDIFSRHFLFII